VTVVPFEGVELLILDNLSSLTVGLRENDSDAWSPIQQWLLQLRRRGAFGADRAHAGKTGGQRGTILGIRTRAEHAVGDAEQARQSGRDCAGLTRNQLCL
jgi:hypothetical protein